MSAAAALDRPTVTPINLPACPRRSLGGTCLCVPACDRCGNGLHMAIHGPSLGASEALPFDHLFVAPPPPEPVAPPLEPQPLTPKAHAPLRHAVPTPVTDEPRHTPPATEPKPPLKPPAPRK